MGELGTGSTGTNSSGGEIFLVHPDWPRGPPSLLYDGYWVSSLGVKQPECGVDHLLPSIAEAKERVEVYLYSHSWPSWPVLE
jgi:hypothetical protein